MPGIFKLLTGLVALTGDMSILVTGEINPIFLFPASLLFLGYLRAIKGQRQLSRYVVGGLSTLSVIVFIIDAVYISGDLIVAVSHLTLIFHGIKSFDIKEPWDSLQVFFMSLIQVMLASELTSSLFFGVVFIVFMILIVFSLFYAHLLLTGRQRMRGYLRDAVMITLFTTALSLFFFPTLPRLKSSIWGKSIGHGIKTGFSEKVKLGGLQELKIDDTPVLRASITPPLREPPYWRGITFEFYENNTWHDIGLGKNNFTSNEGRFEIGRSPKGMTYKGEFILEPLETEFIFIPGRLRSLETASKRLIGYEDGAFSIPFKKGKRLRYLAEFDLSSPAPTENDYVYLQLPSGTERIRDLTMRITKDASTPELKAEKIESYLKSNYTYSLSVPPPPLGASPIEGFLFHSRRGYCEYYASAMVLMLRSIGIPARVVSGYLGGEYNRYGGYYIIRQSDAHTWVEAFVAGRWRRFDPTPSVSFTEKTSLFLVFDYLKLKWERYIVGFSRMDQRVLAITLFNAPLRLSKILKIDSKKPLFGILSAVLGVVFIFVILKNIFIRPGKTRPETVLYLKLKKRLLHPRKRTTAEDGFLLLQLARPDTRVGRLISEFIALYREIRFGPRMDNDKIRKLRELYREIKKEK